VSPRDTSSAPPSSRGAQGGGGVPAQGPPVVSLRGGSSPAASPTAAASRRGAGGGLAALSKRLGGATRAFLPPPSHKGGTASDERGAEASDVSFASRELFEAKRSESSTSAPKRIVPLEETLPNPPPPPQPSDAVPEAKPAEEGPAYIEVKGGGGIASRRECRHFCEGADAARCCRCRAEGPPPRRLCPTCVRAEKLRATGGSK
jgi:hypothetical protein